MIYASSAYLWLIAWCWQVESLKAKLLEKLELSLMDLNLKAGETNKSSVDPNDTSKEGSLAELLSPASHEVKSGYVAIWQFNWKGFKDCNFRDSENVFSLSYQFNLLDLDADITKHASYARYDVKVLQGWLIF